MDFVLEFFPILWPKTVTEPTLIAAVVDTVVGLCINFEATVEFTVVLEALTGDFSVLFYYGVSTLAFALVLMI